MNDRVSVSDRLNNKCPSEAKDDNIYARVLHDACVKLGGERALADYLQLPMALVDDWLRGGKRPPDDVFLKCLDILEAG